MMDFQAFPKIARLSREMIITEKIDGTNAQIYICESKLENLPPHYESFDYAVDSQLGLHMFAGSRSRYLSQKNDNYGFCRWMHENATELFKLGPGRHFGEWWGQGIQRGYGLHEKRFSLFNTTRWDPRPVCCHIVPVLHVGPFNTSDIDTTLETLKDFGSQAAPGFMNPEGIVVYHPAGNVLFKKTIVGDEVPKSKAS